MACTIFIPTTQTTNTLRDLAQDLATYFRSSTNLVRFFRSFTNLVRFFHFLTMFFLISNICLRPSSVQLAVIARISSLYKVYDSFETRLNTENEMLEVVPYSLLMYHTYDLLDVVDFYN